MTEPKVLGELARTVFGGSHWPESSWAYQEARRLGQLLARAGLTALNVGTRP